MAVAGTIAMLYNPKAYGSALKTHYGKSPQTKFRWWKIKLTQSRMLPDEMKVRTKGLVGCERQWFRELFLLGLVVFGVIIAFRNHEPREVECFPHRVSNTTLMLEGASNIIPNRATCSCLPQTINKLDIQAEKGLFHFLHLTIKDFNLFISITLNFCCPYKHQ